jgi:hypothetical protein
LKIHEIQIREFPQKMHHFYSEFQFNTFTKCTQTKFFLIYDETRNGNWILGLKELLACGIRIIWFYMTRYKSGCHSTTFFSVTQRGHEWRWEREDEKDVNESTSCHASKSKKISLIDWSKVGKEIELNLEKIFLKNFLN